MCCEGRIQGSHATVTLAIPGNAFTYLNFLSSSRNTPDIPNMPSKSSFIAFIKSIVSFRGDLSTVTAPTFLLQPQSYTEYAGLWASQPSLFVASAGESDPAKRAVLVLKWFLSTIRPRLYGRNEKPLAKKPLNPFFGELYLGRWEDEESGRTEMYVEQVGHHPPCTAICVRNDRHGVKVSIDQ